MALEASDRLIDTIWVNWRCTWGCISRPTFKLSASLLDIMKKSKEISQDLRKKDYRPPQVWFILGSNFQTPVAFAQKLWRRSWGRYVSLLKISDTIKSSVWFPLSLENKIDDLRGRLNYQRDIQNCNILCFTESWLNDDTINIQLSGYTLYRQDTSCVWWWRTMYFGE